MISRSGTRISAARDLAARYRPSSMAANTWRVLPSLCFLGISNITIRTYPHMVKQFLYLLDRNVKPRASLL